MENLIYFRRPQKPRIPVTLTPHRWGPNGHLIVASADQQVWFAISGNIATLITQLRAATKQLTEMVCTEAERGIIQGEAESQSQQFNLITIDDLNGDHEHDWKLLEARFPWLFKKSGEQAAPSPNGNGQAVDQAGLDAELCRDLAEDLFDDEGELTWGAQSKIAKRLGIKNSGESNRERIMGAAAVLRQEFIKSTQGGG